VAGRDFFDAPNIFCYQILHWTPEFAKSRQAGTQLELRAGPNQQRSDKEITVADKPTNTRRALWETAFNNLTALNQQLDKCQSQDRDALERAIADQEDDLLDTPAPSFSALLAKLELLFEGQLEGLDAEAEHRRLVVEDLSDLIEETRELIGERA
jgi:hypothetical protein